MGLTLATVLFASCLALSPDHCSGARPCQRMSDHPNGWMIGTRSAHRVDAVSVLWALGSAFASGYFHELGPHPPFCLPSFSSPPLSPLLFPFLSPPPPVLCSLLQHIAGHVDIPTAFAPSSSPEQGQGQGQGRWGLPPVRLALDSLRLTQYSRPRVRHGSGPMRPTSLHTSEGSHGTLPLHLGLGPIRRTYLHFCLLHSHSFCAFWETHLHRAVHMKDTSRGGIVLPVPPLPAGARYCMELDLAHRRLHCCLIIWCSFPPLLLRLLWPGGGPPGRSLSSISCASSLPSCCAFPGQEGPSADSAALPAGVCAHRETRDHSCGPRALDRSRV